MHPFLDAGKLSDDELSQRLNKAYTHLAHQTSLGHMPTIQSIKEVIDTLETEKSARLQKFIFGDQSKEPNTSIDLGKIDND